ncbi:MAG: hypothetical protein KDC49_19770 [Saprospiraceae bacterium]|nr:hypothetical protein [Saprospiraceae bacterium]
MITIRAFLLIAARRPTWHSRKAAHMAQPQGGSHRTAAMWLTSHSRNAALIVKPQCIAAQSHHTYKDHMKHYLLLTLLLAATSCHRSISKDQSPVNQEQERNDAAQETLQQEKILLLNITMVKDSTSPTGENCALYNHQIAPGKLKGSLSDDEIPPPGHLMFYFKDANGRVLATQSIVDPLTAFVEYAADDDGNMGRKQLETESEILSIRVQYQTEMTLLDVYKMNELREKQKVCTITLKLN